MTTGEKLAALRRQKGFTQARLAEILQVSRQSVSRWEMDAAFPETDKLILLSRLLNCSIDFLLNNASAKNDQPGALPAADECYTFIRECGYFFLATAVDGKPRLRPMGMIHVQGDHLYIATDRRKSVYADLMSNPSVELACYNLNTRKWLRISGTMEPDSSVQVLESMLALYPMISQEFIQQDEIHLIIFRLQMEQATLL